MEEQKAKGRKSPGQGFGQGSQCIWGVRESNLPLWEMSKRPDGLKCGLASFAWDDHSFDIFESIVVLGVKKKGCMYFFCMYLSIHLFVSLIDSFLQ